jgi:hypothetical protein
VAPAKPQLTIDTVAAAASQDPAIAEAAAKALDGHNSAIEAWGDGLALQLGRVCRSAVRLELARVECPPP